jgi:hypothetical protein
MCLQLYILNFANIALKLMNGELVAKPIGARHPTDDQETLGTIFYHEMRTTSSFSPGHGIVGCAFRVSN